MSTIALFHPSFTTPGGAELLCVSEGKSLRAQGEEISIVTFGFDPARWAAAMDGLPVQVVPKRRWSDLLTGFTRQAKLRARAKRAASFLASADVVVAHNYPCSTMLGLAGRAGRKVWQCNEPPRGLHVVHANPVLSARVVEGRGEPVDFSTLAWREKLKGLDRLGSKLGPRVEQDLESARRLDHIFAISQFSRDNARRIYGRCGEEVVYPIVTFPEGGRSRAGLDRSGLQVLVHSRLEVLKNIDTVIRGFRRFRAGHPGAFLHLVGDGEARGPLEALAAELLPPGSYAFHGYLPTPDLKAVYDRCDVLALLTLDEPFGMVFPEAAAKGLLLIGPDHGGPFEILDGGRLGWCVDPFAPEAVAEALEEVWALPDVEVQRRREEADRACRGRFSESVIGPQLRRVILHGQD
ncbi:MAG TPA: glycosyltransferase family 4 protein [Holophagaceae bacterium]|nr:glycosyltransferase family 4 protein [Holophagaceae bacterium]